MTAADYGLKKREYIEISYFKLDEIVEQVYKTAYSTMDSGEFHNDMYLTYTKYTFEEISGDIAAGDHDEAFAKWEAIGLERLPNYTDEFIRRRDHLVFIDWQVILTRLILDGHLDEAEYLLEISY